MHTAFKSTLQPKSSISIDAFIPERAGKYCTIHVNTNVAFTCNGAIQKKKRSRDVNVLREK